MMNIQETRRQGNKGAGGKSKLRKYIKLSVYLLCIFLFLSIILALFNYERLLRLYHVNNLFSQENIVSNFSNMQKLFLTIPVKRGDIIYQWEEEPKELVQNFAFEGRIINVANYLKETATTSLLVVSNGKISFEEYYLGSSAQDRRISWSIAKSFLSALFGIALEEGYIDSLDDAVTKYVPELEQSAYNGVAIIDVLRMASGVKFNEDYMDFNSDINRMGRILALGGSMDKFAIGIKDRVRKAGTARQYVSIDTHILAMVLRAVTSKSIAELLSEKIWSKIGPLDDAYYISDGYGVAFALGGLNMRSRDYALFGQLFLQKGKWGEEQIIPLKWAIDSVLPSAPPSIYNSDKFGYGYQWWVPLNAEEEFFATGIYGQYIYVNRKMGVVIVKTSADRNFRNDGAGGNLVKRKTIEMFRAIAKSQ